MAPGVLSVDLDDAWGDVHRKSDGSSLHYLEAPDGSQVQLFMDASFGYVQAFTTTDFATDGGMVTAVAVEPMTAPAAARSGTAVSDLQVQFVG